MTSHIIRLLLVSGFFEMDHLVLSSESSDDDAAQVPLFRFNRERITFVNVNRQSFLEAFRLTRMQDEYLLTDLGLG